MHIEKVNDRFLCPICQKDFSQRHSAQRHLANPNIHPQITTSAAVSPPNAVSLPNSLFPTTSALKPSINPPYYDEDLQKVYAVNAPWMREFKRSTKLLDTYSIRIETPDFKSILTSIFKEQKHPFKTNLEIGFILRRNDTGNYRYYFPEKNTALFDVPMIIASTSDLDKVITAADSSFETGDYMNVRPDSNSVYHELVNVLVKVYKMIERPIGNPTMESRLKQHIKNLKSVVSFFNSGRRVAYKDNLCFFRCLAASRLSQKDGIDTLVRQLADTWCSIKEIHLRAFRGVTLTQLPELEHTFEVNIFVYTLEKSQDRYIAQLHRRSLSNYRDRLDLLLFKTHFCWIRKLHQFSKSWKCHCGTFFSLHYQYMRHTKDCKEMINHKYPGGGFGLQRTIFQDLRDMGLEVADLNFPYRIFYDYECLLRHIEGEAPTDRLTFTKELIPASFSIISNIPGEDEQGRRFMEPQFMANPDPKILIERFYDIASAMAKQAGTFMQTQFQWVIDLMEMKVKLGVEAKSRRQNCNSPSDMKTLDRDIAISKQWAPLLLRFKKWIYQVPILGYNSGKFDFNLIRTYLVPYLLEQNVKIEGVIAKGRDYLAFTLEHLNFLDIMHYVAAGTSYEGFISAFGCKNTKGIWPYEYFDSYERLFETTFPPKEAFHSSLKQTDITDEDYEWLKAEWVRQGWRHLGDMLLWYNNKDVVPGLEAVNRMFDLAAGFGSDMFKDAISLPGVAMRLMFSRQGQLIFQNFDKNTKTWHELIKKNIVGGPSLVFSRYHEAGVTYIRNTDVPAASILGFDANALYLGCTAKEMATGIAAEWKPDNGIGIEVPTSESDDCNPKLMIEENMKKLFSRSSTVKYQMEHVWLMYMFENLSNQTVAHITMRHKFNGGQKFFILPNGSRAYVDGWIPELNLVLEFNGCYFHGHDCASNRSRTEEQAKQSRERAEKTIARNEGLESLGLRVIQAWECEVEAAHGEEPSFKRLRAEHVWTKRRQTAQALLDDVKSGAFFGVIECDIQVPWWKPELREYMAELPPIFKNTTITLDDVGQTMKSYAEANDISYSRTSLIGSFFAIKVVVTTPLLNCYLQLGVEVTRIYQALQYHPVAAFKFVADLITENRRKADVDDNFKALGETSKLYGNSCYGKCATNKEKFHTQKFLNETQAAKAINNKLFRSCEHVGEGVYQVESAKSSITFNLPILVAFFVYAYAKQRMLEFYYGFLLRVLGKENFELIQMDTDSMYFACSAHSLEAAVPISKRDLYAQLKPLFLPCPEAGTDKRTPGLFKLEFKGRRMVAMNSKCYCGDGDSLKVSCKGVSKRTTKLTTDIYLETLLTQRSYFGSNTGFRMRGETMQQYEQQKKAINWFYPKRKVQPDGIKTLPLDI